MLAAVFDGPGQLAIRERPNPRLAHDADVLLQIHACGICGTDLHILAVPPAIPVSPGFILGQEYTGKSVLIS